MRATVGDGTKRVTRVLVTGGSGQLGTVLVPLLRQRGHEVVAPGRREFDLATAGNATAALNASGVQCVVNCAAYTDVDRAEADEALATRVNVQAVAELAAAATDNGARFIHVSTDYVFGASAGPCAPASESATAAPLGVYGKTKWRGEQAALAAAPNAAIVRTAWLYGAHGNNFVKTMLRLARTHETLTVVDDQVGTPTSTRDLAGALAALVEQTGSSGTYHYTNEGVASWYDFAAAIVRGARARGVTLRASQVLPVDSSTFPRPAPRPAWSVLGKARMRALLDSPIPHWQEALDGVLDELAEMLKPCADSS